jgi:hypothetical protein
VYNDAAIGLGLGCNFSPLNN